MKPSISVNNDGPTMVECAILVSLISVAIILAVRAVITGAMFSG